MTEAFTPWAGATLLSPSGCSVEINSNGSLRRFDCGATSLLLFPGSEAEGGPANVYLRRLGESPSCTPLLGPFSRTRFGMSSDDSTFVGLGSFCGIDYSITLRLAQSAAVWFWHVSLENTASSEQVVDLTYAQDIALAPYAAVRTNEFYVSQYIDHTPLIHPARGVMIASRQNQAAAGRNPWSLIGALGKGASFATDALQFYGLGCRTGANLPAFDAELPSRRLQHEHSMVVVRDAPMRLATKARVTCGFFGVYCEHHPAATSTADVERVSEILALPEAAPPARGSNSDGAGPVASLFTSTPPLQSIDLSDAALRALFPSPWRHVERDDTGALLSLFYGDDRHVVLRRKEERVLRPHGHLLRTGLHLSPDERALTSTAWMDGVFHSMLTQGHVSINRFLSTTHSYLGLFRSHGQRVFVQIGGTWRLLDTPSVFEMSPNACRWIYRHATGEIHVLAAARGESHELTLSVEFISGDPTRCLISHHVALNGDDGNTPGSARWRLDGKAITVSAVPDSDVGRRFPDGHFEIAPIEGTRIEQVGGDELLFNDGRSRQQPFVCVVTAPARRVGLGIRGNLIAASRPAPLLVESAKDLTPTFSLASVARGPLADALLRLVDIVPWYAHNALVHYLSPRGLEQYSGGGWGTRDVCQGPVELLLALGRPEGIRDVLLRVMRQQNPDGDWPQWFMFFERERTLRTSDSHGDIVFWPLLALAQYLIVTGDSTVLDERVPFFDSRGPESGEPATIWEHAQRALALIRERIIPGTSLAAYGHGDWNDSLQPADSRDARSNVQRLDRDASRPGVDDARACVAWHWPRCRRIFAGAMEHRCEARFSALAGCGRCAHRVCAVRRRRQRSLSAASGGRRDGRSVQRAGDDPRHSGRHADAGTDARTSAR